VKRDSSLPLQQCVKSDEPRAGANALGAALERETKLLGDLLQVLTLHREAVASDDLSTIDDTIFSVQRILRTLAEARKKRRTILEIMGIDPETPMDELEGSLNPSAAPELREAVQAFRAIALELTGEVEINQKVLNCAFESRRTFIEALGGGPD
jgi:hypothetical protein